MDRRQAGYEIRRRTLGLCNGYVRRLLSARSDSFTWNAARSGVRYCPLKEPAPSLYFTVSDSSLAATRGAVRRLRDLAPSSSYGCTPFGKSNFSFHQERLAVKPVEGPLTLLTLATFSKDQIMQALSDLRGCEVNSVYFRTTFLQYLQVCRKTHIRFKVQLADGNVQCLACLQHAQVPYSKFKCDCLSFKFSNLQDCNCMCGTSAYCCTCDEMPLLCNDLDVLSDLVSAVQMQFQALDVCTDQTYADEVMRLASPSECQGVRVLEESSTIRLSQFEPP